MVDDVWDAKRSDEALARSRRREAGGSTETLGREKGVPDVFQDLGVSLQRWRDCFAEFEESDRPIQESFQLRRLDERFAGCSRCQLRIECRGQDEHVPELTKDGWLAHSGESFAMGDMRTYACAVPKMLVMIIRAGTWSNTVVLRIAAITHASAAACTSLSKELWFGGAISVGLRAM
jgi:hypothetical protein